MDPITLERIKLLHPKIRPEALKIYTYINNTLFGKQIRLRFTHTLRTIAEQNELYNQGRIKLFDTNAKKLKIVTNAKGGQSIHNYGLAVDIVVLIDKDNNGSFETASWDINTDNDNDGIADWKEVVTHFKKSGWVWGGDWKSFPDYPHFEKTFGHTWKTLQAKYNAGDVFTEVIDGKEYKWVNL